MDKEITNGCKRVTVLLQGEWAGRRIAETVTADYWLTCAVSPDLCADDVAVCGLWDANGSDLLCGEGENYSDLPPRIAYLYRAACSAVAGAVVMDADDGEWLGWDAWLMPHDDPADRIAIAASAARGY